MAKAQKRKAEEPVSISKIYEAIKATDFIQELWCDIIVDIQEKPTYKRIKDMVNALVNNTIEEFSDDPQNEAERLKRRTMLTEISIMTYTVDTIISELLSKKLMSEFQYIVENIVREIRPDIAPPSLSGAAGPSHSGRNWTEPTSLPPTTSPTAASSSEEVPKKRGRPRKDQSDSASTSYPKAATNSSSPSSPKKRGRPRKYLRPGESSNASSSPENIAKGPKPSLSLNNGVKDQHKEDNESDAESSISDALSLTSVSSVHTSELSSFEDTISIDGDEDGEKKQIPLKVAKELYMKGTLSQIYRIGKKTKNQKKTKKPLSADENSQSSLSDSGSQKILPQRIRKPNSKYCSDTIICETYQTVDVSPLRKEKTVPQAKLSPKKLFSDKAITSSVSSSPEKNCSAVSPSKKSTLKA